MKIALYSSKRERCGISTYTEVLAVALRALGHDVEYYSSRLPYDPRFKQILAWRPDVFHFQHEPSIMPPDSVAAKFANELRDRGTKVFLTLHTENSNTVKAARQILKNMAAAIMHRPSLLLQDAMVIPMPCPVLDPLPDRSELREKYVFPKNAFVISTVGFLIPWKDHPRIVQLMGSWLAEHPEAHLQVIASPHFNSDLQSYASQATVAIMEFMENFGQLYTPGRIRHVNHYPSDQELLERVALSDLGYVWCPMHTGSASAAGAMFTSARCPLVASDSTHYAYLGEGIIRSSKDNLPGFVQTIQKIAGNPELLASLRKEQEAVYKERNYLEIARRHVELYLKEKA